MWSTYLCFMYTQYRYYTETATYNLEAFRELERRSVDGCGLKGRDKGDGVHMRAILLNESSSVNPEGVRAIRMLACVMILLRFRPLSAACPPPRALRLEGTGKCIECSIGEAAKSCE